MGRRPPLPPLLSALTATLLAPLPMAATPAGELNLAAIRRYSSPAGHPARNGDLARFNDVRPGDWAWQALANLGERYGCLSASASVPFQGGRAISRFEAAALLSACLARAGTLSEELQALSTEFARELALLRGRVDGLEARAGELEATLFSPTTTLSGLASFVVGANGFSGSAGSTVQASRRGFGATTFSYDLELTLDTSFNGRDLLRTNLRGGNFADSSFGGAGPTPLSQLEVAFQQGCGTTADCGDVVAIDRLFYQAPFGDFTFSVGARIGQDDMLAIWPSVYPADTILDVLTLAGAPAAYDRSLGAGAGLWWQKNGFAVSASYVAALGDDATGSEGGIGTAGAAGTGTLQIGYSREQWGLAAIYASIQNGNDLILYASPFTLASFSEPGDTAAFALSGYWQPTSSGWLPSISLGWGLNRTSYDSGVEASGLVRTSQSWSVGLQWSDVLGKGNALGMAVGQPVFATSLVGGATPADGNWAWESWFKLQVSDAISVTPAVFYLSRPLGQDTPAGRTFQQLGALVKTSLRF